MLTTLHNPRWLLHSPLSINTGDAGPADVMMHYLTHACSISLFAYPSLYPSRSAVLGQGKHWLAQCQDNVTQWDGILGHDAGGLISQWGSTIKSPSAHTVTSLCLSWYDFWCCQNVKLNQPTRLALNITRIGKEQRNMEKPIISNR